MKKILFAITALSVSAALIGTTGASASTLESSNTQTYKQNIVLKSNGGVSTQGYDEVSATITTSVTGNYVVTKITPWGGSGSFSATVAWRALDQTAYGSSTGQGVSFNASTYIYQKGLHNALVTLRSGGLTYTGSTTATIQ